MGLWAAAVCLGECRGTLAINRSDTFTLSNDIWSDPNGVLVQSGSGTTILTGAYTLNGVTTISAGTLQLRQWRGQLVRSARRHHRQCIAGLQSQRQHHGLANAISGTGTLTQAGSGTVILTAQQHLYRHHHHRVRCRSGDRRQYGHRLAGQRRGSSTMASCIYNSPETYRLGHGGKCRIPAPRRLFSQYRKRRTSSLSGIDTYTGATSVTAGTLSVDGAIASSSVTVSSGATLGGAGTVGAASIQSGGTLAPGDGVGTLQVNGNLTLASGATDAEEVSPSAADEILVSGNASIAGTLTENFAGGSYGHQTYTILHSTGALSGTFANVSVTGLPAGLTATLSYDANDVYLTTDHAPVVTTTNLTELHGQTLAVSSLFTVSDADNDTITEYQLWDGTNDPNSGHFVVNGVVQAADTVIDITAAQLAQTSFVTGSVGDRLQIRAFDGMDWSAADSAQWSPFTISIAANHPPVVTTSDVAAQRNQTLAASSLFTVSDADGDAITEYQLWDGNDDPLSGYFVLNGVAQAAQTVIDIPASQLSQLSFVTGTTADRLQVRAWDGTAWSAADNAQWAPFNVTVPVNHPPVVTTSNLTRQGNQTLAASSLFSVSDADGDAITRYQLWDGNADPASGYFVVGGVAQAARTVIDISAAQLSQVSFVTGSVSDYLQIRASDGTLWSAADSAQWSPFTITVPVNHAPVVTTSNLTEPHDQTLALSSLFTVSDADGDAMTKYQLWDGTADPNSGYFTVAGVAQAPRTVIEITAAQLGQVNFVTGGVGDNIQIRAFDGAAWSAGDSAQWSPFTITVPANHAPVVTTADIIAPAGQSLSPSSLFSVSDADGDAITEYQFWDGTADPSSGHFVVGGVAQAARTVIDIPASQLGQVSFLAGTATDMLQVRAFDGRSWSAADSAQWAPFHVAAS